MERGPYRRSDVVSRANYQQYAAIDDPIGCGLLGCLGGVVFGLFGGIIVLFFVAFVAALAASVPLPEPTSGPDLRVTLDENFINRFAEQPTDGTIHIDIMPNNQIAIVGNTTLQGFGIQAPVQVTGIFDLQLTGQTLQVTLLKTEVAGFSVPPELDDLFVNDVPLINQNLDTMATEISNILGVPVIFTNVSTDNVQILLDIREAQ